MLRFLSFLLADKVECLDFSSLTVLEQRKKTIFSKRRLFLKLKSKFLIVFRVDLSLLLGDKVDSGIYRVKVDPDIGLLMVNVLESTLEWT